MTVPQPPETLFESLISFAPSEELEGWARTMFIADDAQLYNPEHSHLQFAIMGFLWTTYTNVTKGHRVIGMAERFNARCNKWKRARQEQQIKRWFGDVPDFIITIDAEAWKESTNPQRFALIEHELYHCAQYTIQGIPQFNDQTGKPKFTIRGHDVEEFVGVVERYGADATGIQDMVKAANKGPEIAPAKIDGLCGTCDKKVA